MKNTPTTYSKETITYAVLLIVVLVLVVLRACSFGFGFFSLWDEAFLLLKCRNAYDGIVGIQETSLWAFLATKWFPYLDLTNEIQSSWASIVLLLFGVLNASIASILILKRSNWIKYISLFLLVMLPVISGHYEAEMPHRMGWGTEINYVVIQSFLATSSLSAFLLAYYVKSEIWRFSAFTMTGIFCGLGLYVNIPSTALLLLGYFILIWILFWHDFNQIIFASLFGMVGVVIACVYLHVFVMDIQTAYETMRHTAQTISQWGLNYTPFAFIGQVVGLLFSMLKTGIICAVVYILSLYVCKRNYYIGGVVYVGLILYSIVYLHPHYRIAPASCMFLNAMLVPCVLEYVKKNYDDSASIYKKIRIAQQATLNIFLLIFPLLVAMGTNTAMYGRIACFMGAWVFLWILNEDKYKDVLRRFVLVATLMCMIVPISHGLARTYYHHYTLYTTHLSQGTESAKELSLTTQQRDYYEHIGDLLRRYNYQPKESVIFASMYDWATVYLFDAQLSNDFHQKEVFPFVPKQYFLKPDFIILTEEEKNVYHLENFPWGWPEEWDEYELGTPETICNKFCYYEGMKRYIYCKKNKYLKND